MSSSSPQLNIYQSMIDSNRRVYKVHVTRAIYSARHASLDMFSKGTLGAE